MKLSKVHEAEHSQKYPATSRLDPASDKNEGKGVFSLTPASISTIVSKRNLFHLLVLLGNIQQVLGE